VLEVFVVLLTAIQADAEPAVEAGVVEESEPFDEPGAGAPCPRHCQPWVHPAAMMFAAETE
jgi:hypothetical protein